MEDTKLIEQYKSYFDKLQNGYPTKEYAGSKLIATNKSQFCENGSCKFIGQDIQDNSTKSETVSKTKTEETSTASTHNSNNSQIVHNIAIRETKDFLMPSVNHLASPPNHLQFMTNNSRQSTFFQNGLLNQPNFQRFNGMNRSFRFPVRNSNIKFGNNFYNGGLF